MIACAACSRENPPGAKFCAGCGTALALRCPSCDAPARPDASFCIECGTALGTTTEPPPSPAVVPAAGEKKHITVLFADVAGSMDLQERLDAEVWAQIMGRFVSILAEGVRRFGGTVDKFTGDGIMALFGAPVAQEDHARRACHAAWHLTKAIGQYSEELNREQGVELEVRLGLNSGEVVVGRVGNDVTLDPTALGHTVGLAQRMEAMAEPGSVYLTGATADLVSGYFELRNLGAMEVKGVQGPLRVFELGGPGASRTPLEVAAERGLSRFVGRDRELAMLQAAMVDATRGGGRVVGIVAEPGVGKSRLCHEFAEGCREQGVDVFAAHALAHTRSVPFVPVLEMLRTLFGISDRDEPPSARAKISTNAADLDSGLQSVLPLLYDFLGVPDPEHPAPTMDPEARQRRIFAALNALRRIRSAQRPFVMLIEDLHWLDPGSEAFLENLVNSTAGTRVLVVTTCRPEYRAPWAHRTHYAQLPVGPLVDEATDELLGDLLGQHPSVDGVAELVRQRTGGNPFFVEEVVHGLVDEGSLEGERGRYQLVRTIEEIRIPATVHAVLAARIDRLGDQPKMVLQTAAVIGRQFSARLLGLVTGLPATELEATARALVDTELIYETSAYPEQEHAFKHALVEEVAYGSQLTQRRASVHANVARALAALDVEKVNERASLIAHHFELGGDPIEAARWNARAAEWVIFTDPAEAARHWRRVRRLTDHRGFSADTAELAIMARSMLLACHLRGGAMTEEGPVRYEDEAAQMFAEAEQLADAADQPVPKALAMANYGAILATGEQVEDGYQAVARAARLVDEVGDSGLRVSVRIYLAYFAYSLGRFGEAAAITDKNLEILGDDRSIGRGVSMVSPWAWSQMFSANCRAYQDRLDIGLAALDAAIRIAGEEGDSEAQAWTRRYRVVLADLAGLEDETVFADALAALEWADHAAGPWPACFTRQGVAISYAQRGEWDQALRTVAETVSIIRGRRVGLALMPQLLVTRARAELGLGNVAAARSSAEEALAAALRCRTRSDEARARIQLARVILADSPSELAVANRHLEIALGIVNSLGIRAYEPHVHLAMSEAARALGDHVTYELELSTAQRMFVEVGASGHARRVEAELWAKRVE